MQTVIWSTPLNMLAVAAFELLVESRTAPTGNSRAEPLSTAWCFELVLASGLILALGWAYNGRCGVFGVVGGPGSCGPFTFLAQMLILITIFSPFALVQPFALLYLVLTLVAFRTVRSYRGI